MAGIVSVDCSAGGSEVSEEHAPERMAEIEALRSEHAQSQATSQAERDIDLELIRAEAQKNPAFAALARYLGIN